PLFPYTTLFRSWIPCALRSSRFSLLAREGREAVLERLVARVDRRLVLLLPASVTGWPAARELIECEASCPIEAEEVQDPLCHGHGNLSPRSSQSPSPLCLDQIQAGE